MGDYGSGLSSPRTCPFGPALPGSARFTSSGGYSHVLADPLPHPRPQSSCSCSHYWPAGLTSSFPFSPAPISLSILPSTLHSLISSSFSSSHSLGILPLTFILRVKKGSPSSSLYFLASLGLVLSMAVSSPSATTQGLPGQLPPAFSPGPCNSGMPAWWRPHLQGFIAIYG